MNLRISMTLSRRTSRMLSLAILAVCLYATALAEKPQQLKPRNFVNDFAGVLDQQTQARLNAMCLDVQQKTNAQITVVTIKALEDQSVEDFAVTLFKQWG